VLTVHADQEERMVLSTWRVPQRYGYTYGSIGRSDARRWKRFDEAELAQPVILPDGSARVVVVDRAEELDVVGIDQHWLRLSAWKVDASGHVTLDFAKDLSPKESEQGHMNIDMASMGNDRYAVVFRSSHGKDRLRVFHVDWSEQRVRAVGDTFAIRDMATVSGPHVAASRDIVATSSNVLGTFHVATHRWDGGGLSGAIAVSAAIEGEVLDLAIVENSTGRFVVAVAAAGDNHHLHLYAWPVMAAGTLGTAAAFDGRKGDELLVGRQMRFERASVRNVMLGGEPGFVLVAKAAALSMRQGKSGEPHVSGSGLKIMHGTVLPDGRPTVTSWAVHGSNDEGDAAEMLDTTSDVDAASDGTVGVVTVHDTYDDYLRVIYWRYSAEWARLPLSVQAR
jgi:hypothetical protein